MIASSSASDWRRLTSSAVATGSYTYDEPDQATDPRLLPLGEVPAVAYSEGWALYAERLAWELGFQDDPYDNIGRLQAELFRAVRLVVDTGIHAMRWTREEAIDYFRENTPISDGDIVTEVERYFVNPGQALGYKVGMMKILELRERAREALGDEFDIRAFHDVVIGRGPMPLSILERQVEAWLANDNVSGP